MAGTTGFALSPAHLMPLLDFGVSKTAARWKMLGVALEFEGGELAVIEGTPQNITGGPNACLADLLARWLNWAPPKPWPTLERLVAALRMEMVGEFRLAYDLENNFKSSTASAASSGPTPAVGGHQSDVGGSVSAVQTAASGAQSLPLNSGTQAMPRKSDCPKVHQLQYLKSNDGSVIKVVEEAAQQWETLAYALDFPHSTVNIVSRDNSQNAVGACREILGRWLDGVKGTRQPISWSTLIEALKECDMNKLADNLHAVLS